MITVSIRRTRSSLTEVYTADHITWQESTRHFTIWDTDNNVITTFEPIYLEVKQAKPNENIREDLTNGKTEATIDLAT